MQIVYDVAFQVKVYSERDVRWEKQTFETAGNGAMSCDCSDARSVCASQQERLTRTVSAWQIVERDAVASIKPSLSFMVRFHNMVVVGDTACFKQPRLSSDSKSR